MKEFISVFQLDKLTMFEVDYYTLGANQQAHFTTEANHFMRNKRHYNICGQAQDTLLPNFPEAYSFYKKWDKYHLQSLTKAEYAEMRLDLENLMTKYNYMIRELNEEDKPYNPYFRFSEMVEFSKQKLKKVKKV